MRKKDPKSVFFAQKNFRSPEKINKGGNEPTIKLAKKMITLITVIFAHTNF